MMDDEALLSEFNKNVGDFFPATLKQRNEIYKSYEYRDCNQWQAEDLKERERLGKAITMVNLAAPLIRAVSGTEVMQDKALGFVAIDEDFNTDADIMSDGVEYAQHVSGYDSEQSLAREDAATCGIAGTVTYLDMSKKGAIAGVPMVERIFPGFLYYDNSSRGARLNDRARWCGYADPVDVDQLTDYMKEKLNEKDVPESGGGGVFNDMLLSFSNQDNLHKIDMLYHYFWWEYDDIIDVANPFEKGSALNATLIRDKDAAEMIGEMADRLNIDWEAAYFSFDTASYKDFRETLETVLLLTDTQIPSLETSKRKGKCYYRAEIARGHVLSKSRSYTQGGHPLNFITGYYDERQGIYYGMMRPLSYVQDALNMSISDFLSYARSASHGGSAYIKGSKDTLERLKKEKAHEDSLTPLPADAEVIGKALPNTPQVLVEFIRLMMEIMPRAVGLGQEFLGVITSGDMTDSLYGKVMRQSYAVLANFANNSASYSKRQGEIFVDIIKLMADANDGMILPILSPGKKAADYIRLKKQNLAREYAVRIVERPMTADERQDTFNKLSALLPQMQQAGANIVPILMRYAPLDQEDKDEMIELATPKPQPPDPLNVALLQSQTRYQNASAAKLEADAQETSATIDAKLSEIQSSIEKNLAQADKARAESGKEDTLDPADMIMREKEMNLREQEYQVKRLSLEKDIAQINKDRREAGTEELELSDDGVTEKPNQYAEALMMLGQLIKETSDSQKAHTDTAISNQTNEIVDVISKPRVKDIKVKRRGNSETGPITGARVTETIAQGV